MNGARQSSSVCASGDEVGVGVGDAVQDALRLLLDVGIGQVDLARLRARRAADQRGQHLGRRLPGQVGQHHLQRQRVAVQQLQQLAQVRVAAVLRAPCAGPGSGPPARRRPRGPGRAGCRRCRRRCRLPASLRPRASPAAPGSAPPASACRKRCKRRLLVPRAGCAGWPAPRR